MFSQNSSLMSNLAFIDMTGKENEACSSMSNKEEKEGKIIYLRFVYRNDNLGDSKFLQVNLIKNILYLEWNKIYFCYPEIGAILCLLYYVLWQFTIESNINTSELMIHSIEDMITLGFAFSLASRLIPFSWKAIINLTSSALFKKLKIAHSFNEI